MKRTISMLALLAAAGFLAGHQPAAAVPPGNMVTGGGASGGGASYQPSRPAVSPYITLAPGIGSGLGGYNSLNYFTFIRPMQQQQQINRQNAYQLNNLQQEVQLGQQQIYGQNGMPAIRATGHHAWFQTQYSYFGGRMGSAGGGSYSRSGGGGGSFSGAGGGGGGGYQPTFQSSGARR